MTSDKKRAHVVGKFVGCAFPKVVINIQMTCILAMTNFLP